MFSLLKRIGKEIKQAYVSKDTSGPADRVILLLKIGVRNKIFHAIHWHAKYIDKYMKYYGPNKESSHLIYWHIRFDVKSFMKISEKK